MVSLNLVKVEYFGGIIMTEWMKAAEAQKENYLNDLVALMKIPSVRDDAAATDEYPLGPRPAQA